MRGQAAERISGTSKVATVATETMHRLQIDSERMARILRTAEGPVLNFGEFEIKRIDAEPDALEKFGVLVRRRVDQKYGARRAPAAG